MLAESPSVVRLPGSAQCPTSNAGMGNPRLDRFPQ